MDYNEMVDDAMNNILYYDKKTKEVHPKVCIVCDIMVNPSRPHKIGLETFMGYTALLYGDANVATQLREHYRFNMPESNENMRIKKQILAQCLLSPRSHLCYDTDTPHVFCCPSCKAQLQAGKTPKFAIANGMTIGVAPPCLQELNEVEIALLSQARLRGHVFAYWAGCHKSIKGWHCFYEVDPSHTMGVLQVVQELTSTDNIAVVLSGPFTSEQKQQIMAKVNIRIPKVLEAFAWLKENNQFYKDSVAPTIGPLQVIDRSRNVDGENTDIETREQLRVVFPDGSVATGGCQDRTEFERSLAEIKLRCGNVIPFLTSKPSTRLLQDFQNQALLRAFPKQFPFGYGHHLGFNIKAPENGYLNHLVSLSIPAFHEATFVLVVHNLFEKARAFTGSMWRVMGGNERCDVTEEELNTAIFQHLNGLPVSHGPGGRFLNSLKAVRKNMAHTNDAAKTARNRFISLSHHYGCPKLLFTVTFDDSLDIRILTMSQTVDPLQWIASLQLLPPAEMTRSMEHLHTTRHLYPGLCALNFEFLLDIVVNDILKAGYFGELQAYALAVEEQGRKTLHAHIIVYVSGWTKTLQDLHSRNSRTKLKAQKSVSRFVDRVLSTKLVPGRAHTLQKCYACNNALLKYPSHQHIRNLRHQLGARFERGVIATCDSCQMVFEADDVALKRCVPRPFWTWPTAQIKAFVQLQILSSTAPNEPAANKARVAFANYNFNHHVQFHAKTCFKITKECRANLPDIPEPKTYVLYSPELYDHYDWNGSCKQQPNLTIRCQRTPQDLFTNPHNPLISSSKAPCNSNISITVGAKAAMYTSCYAAKATQKEDSADFTRCLSYVAHRFQEERKAKPIFESLSRLMGAVMVNTSQHVCAAPMAAYLVRNGSRFRFSEKFQYIPLREIIAIISSPSNCDNIQMTVLPHMDGCFLTNQALHYLFRNKDAAFDNLSLFSFFEEYEVVRRHRRISDSLENSAQTYSIDDMNHPGFNRQVCRKRGVHSKVLPQFCHWSFPDTACFGGDLFTMTRYPMREEVEEYCKVVLVLFHPFRTVADITIDGSFHRKFVDLYPFKQRVPLHIQNILTNVQMYYDSLRLPAREDPLRAQTTCFRNTEMPPLADDDMEEDNYDCDVDGNIFQTFFLDNQPCQPLAAEHPLTSLSLTSLRTAGHRGCGYQNLPSFAGVTPTLPSLTQRPNVATIPPTFIASSAVQLDVPRIASVQPNIMRDAPYIQTLMQLTYDHTRRRLLSQPEQLPALNQIEATGTAHSIVLWSKHENINLDPEQQLAFQITTAAFVLTYHDDAIQGHSVLTRDMAQMQLHFNQERVKLLQLAQFTGNDPILRMFLDGPGGSGKSRVVQEVLKYAQAFTSKFHLLFNMRTIVVTAMSGVAATSIGGETLHSAACLFKELDPQDTTWANARLLIIDEVSFMSTHDANLLDMKLRTLMGRPTALFGGINILFCGDFRQLKAIGGNPLYSSNYGDRLWVNSITRYIELHGLHRYQEDPQWGQILARIRNGTSDHTDIHEINQCVVTNNRPIPPDAAYCVYGNADRAAINTGFFSNLLLEHWRSDGTLPIHMIVIRGGLMTRRAKKKGPKLPMSVSDIKYVYENCGDHRLRTYSPQGRGGHFVDPLLKLYYHAPLMLLTNDDVPNGHANGTRVRLEAVVLKPHVITTTITIDGCQCPAVDADLVDHIVCTLEGNPSKVFIIRPKSMTCSVSAPITTDTGGRHTETLRFAMTITQLPTLVNNCTTGHKLQGQTKAKLVISMWSTVKNWNYVALSRVKSRAGLYLINPLPYNTTFPIEAPLLDMLATLRPLLAQYIPWDLQAEQEVLVFQYESFTNIAT